MVDTIDPWRGELDYDAHVDEAVKTNVSMFCKKSFCVLYNKSILPHSLFNCQLRFQKTTTDNYILKNINIYNT